jgi:hypothetical protein
LNRNVAQLSSSKNSSWNSASDRALAIGIHPRDRDKTVGQGHYI